MAKASRFTVLRPYLQRAAVGALTNAYGLLIEQPLSVAGLDETTRRNVVISAVIDSGQERVLSRYGDLVWEMWPFVSTPNTPDSNTRLNWSRIPEPFREVSKATVFRYWRVGTEGSTPPGVARLQHFLDHLAMFFRYLESTGVASFADVHPIHITNYVQAQKDGGHVTGTLASKFCALERLYAFRDQHPDGLRFHPWPNSSAGEMAGRVGQARKDGEKDSKTALIPIAVAQALFTHAEKILKNADDILDERDAGRRPAWRDAEVTAIRNACFYLLGVLTGMRSSELSGIEVGAGRTEIRNGYTFHWIKSVEHKTKKGVVEFLMPSMGHDILRVLERWSEPHRMKLAERLQEWEANQGIRTHLRLHQIAVARANLSKLFLGYSLRGIVPVSSTGWGDALRKFAEDAGVDWALAPHQMRRLYAYSFARHRLGGLLFLKEQFKHSSINMTQLYAANPRQDAALYDEILEETRQHKIQTITGWLEGEELLAGGAGKKIMALRAQDFPDRKAIIEETSERITIRSTGHAWCLAQDAGCGGSGIYEKGRCGTCRNGIIDGHFKPFWQETYRHQRELLEEAKKFGPGDVKRVQRDLEEAARVLSNLGVELPAEEPNGSEANG
ncbi:site-specific integrase [Paraburkholderia sp. CNPSo 3274]|uniref:site-specific integrase n=1 Tax=Paraburkholderia sp. CNPSo 3274 TaxID=2940932 RepID=UPI0020B7EF08|nr:site-specific integrase [Paraburkholderia sp. CNPSo 3274]MCP3712374.1 site-specific integrase [Paraburkholderia sp. CNPSo 3274]